jgi:hypothetical protein
MPFNDASAASGIFSAPPPVGEHDRKGHELHSANRVARVERTLLSAAFDVDLDSDFGLDFDFDPLESCTDPCSPVEERRFSCPGTFVKHAMELKHLQRRLKRGDREGHGFHPC